MSCTDKYIEDGKKYVQYQLKLVEYELLSYHRPIIFESLIHYREHLTKWLEDLNQQTNEA